VPLHLAVNGFLYFSLHFYVAAFFSFFVPAKSGQKSVQMTAVSGAFAINECLSN